MAGFTTLDTIALAFFLLSWLGYHFAVEIGPHSGRSLNVVMNSRRARWIREAMERDNRIVDTQVMGGLQNGTAFFASTSLIAVGGALALLRSTDEVLTLVADLPFGLKTTRLVWEMKIVGLVIIFGYAFFKFSWSYRLFNYAAILIGTAPMAPLHDTPEAQAAARRAAAMSIAAARHFNRGQRAFLFALAYLGWFVSPLVFVACTAAVLAVMWRRQFASEARAALDVGPPLDGAGPPAQG